MCASSTSETKLVFASSYQGAAAAMPPVSCAAARMTKLVSMDSFSRDSNTACQPDRSNRHPHQDAQVSNIIFLPLKSESWTLLPDMSVSVKSGASASFTKLKRLAGMAPKLQTALSKSTA